MPIADNYLNGIMGFEGFTPRATWDYKQWTNGYGTRARFPGEVISQAEAKRRYQDEIEAANRHVKSLGVALDPGKEAALTSLTYNAGPKWMQSGLGQAVKSGDWNTAKNLFLQYNKAGGQTLPGLIKRRNAEASWLGGAVPDQTAAPTSSGPPSMTPNQTGVPIPASYSPDGLDMQRKLAMQLMQQGTDASPVQHWTQALARVLQGGVGAYQLNQANKQDGMMRSEGNQLLAQMLSPMTGTPGPAPQMAPQPVSQPQAPMTPEQESVGRFASPGLAAALPQAQPAPQMPPAQVADASGQTIDAATLQRMLANPYTKTYAEAYLKSKLLKGTDPESQADIEYKQAQTAKLRQEMANPKATASEGEKMLDRQFAKTYEEDIAGGKLSDAVSQLQTLETIAGRLENPNGANYSGPMLGMVPETARAFTNPDSVAIQNDLANIIQRSLRPILGAQFTEKEGENLIRRAYNPQLEEGENAKRLRRLVNVTRKMAEQKLAAAKYFEQHGSLKGFNGSANFSIGDVEAAIDAVDTSKPKPDIRSKYQGLE